MSTRGCGREARAPQWPRRRRAWAEVWRRCRQPRLGGGRTGLRRLVLLRIMLEPEDQGAEVVRAVAGGAELARGHMWKRIW